MFIIITPVITFMQSTNLDKTTVGNNLFWINNINERFAYCNFTDATHVKAMYTVPPCKQNRTSMFSTSSKLICIKLNTGITKNTENN